MSEPKARPRSPRAADNSKTAAAASTGPQARRTPTRPRPTANPTPKSSSKRGVPQGLMEADEGRQERVTRMESLSRIVGNLPDAASAAEEERQEIGAQIRSLRNDSLLSERSRSESVEYFLKASEEVEANLTRLQEALSRASSQDDEFFSKVVHRVDSAAATARNPMLPATPRTGTPSCRPLCGGGSGNEAEESEAQKQLFKEMQAHESAASTSDEGSGAAANDEVAKLRQANAALTTRVEELTEGLARAEERADWAVKKSKAQKKQLVEVNTTIRFLRTTKENNRALNDERASALFLDYG